jgi:hypothetical protein
VTFNLKVLGSNPNGPTKFREDIMKTVYYEDISNITSELSTILEEKFKKLDVNLSEEEIESFWEFMNENFLYKYGTDYRQHP